VRPIVLLTDFGLRDPFVGVMKCVIEGIATGARVIDLVHEVPPQDVRAGAVALSTSLAYLPKGAIVAAIVDPGVGTERRAIAMKTERAIFLAPDNGLLTLVRRASKKVQIRALENRRLFLADVSTTFHGRDVFAPVAARLARGLSFDRVGPRIASIVELELGDPVRKGTGSEGEVLTIDRYGNALTNVPGDWVDEGDRVLVRGKPIAKIARTYGAVAIGRAVAMIGSSGTVEIAVNQGDAARRFRLAPGDRVHIKAGR